MELFAVNTRSFQIRTLVSKYWITQAEEAQFIRVDSDRRVGQ